MKMDRDARRGGGEVGMVVSRALCTLQGSLGHRSVSQEGGCWTRHGRDNKEMGKRCRLEEGETDGWRCEGGGGISTGEELCFRSSVARNISFMQIASVVKKEGKGAQQWSGELPGWQRG